MTISPTAETAGLIEEGTEIEILYGCITNSGLLFYNFSGLETVSISGLS